MSPYVHLGVIVVLLTDSLSNDSEVKGLRLHVMQELSSHFQSSVTHWLAVTLLQCSYLQCFSLPTHHIVKLDEIPAASVLDAEVTPKALHLDIQGFLNRFCTVTVRENI